MLELTLNNREAIEATLAAPSAQWLCTSAYALEPRAALSLVARANPKNPLPSKKRKGV